MSKTRKQKKLRHTPKKTSAPQKKAKQPVRKSFFENAEKWFEKNSRILFIIISVLYVIFAFINFNIRITEANDDALYIEAGYKYANDFFNYYYVSNDPL